LLIMHYNTSHFTEYLVILFKPLGGSIAIYFPPLYDNLISITLIHWKCPSFLFSFLFDVYSAFCLNATLVLFYTLVTAYFLSFYKNMTWPKCGPMTYFCDPWTLTVSVICKSNSYGLLTQIWLKNCIYVLISK